MAANYFASSSWRTLVSQQRLSESHVEDRARGLTEEQIQAVKNHFVNCIWELGKLCRLRYRVATSAVMYFRRFYLRNSLCSVDPGLIFAGCVYLASKTEESLVAAKHLAIYARKVRPNWPYDVKHILDTEMVIMEELDFNLVAFSPHRPLVAMLRDLEAHRQQQQQQGAPGELQPDAALKHLGQCAWGVLNDAYRSDVVLMHAPHMLALACITIAAAAKKLDVTTWLATLDVDVQQVHLVVGEVAAVYEDCARLNISAAEVSRLLEAVSEQR